MAFASSGLFTSPLPITGTETASFTSAMTCQSERPENPWLLVNPSFGSSNGPTQKTSVGVSIYNSSLMSIGTYTANLTLSGEGAESVIIPVTLNVLGPPHLEYTPASFEFTGAVGGAYNPPPQTLTLTNTGGGTLTWGVSVFTGTWLSVGTPSSGSLGAGESATVNISAAVGEFSVGDHNGRHAVRA